MSKKIFTSTNLLVSVLLVASVILGGCGQATPVPATEQPTSAPQATAPQATAPQAAAPQATAPQVTQAPAGQSGLPDGTGKRVAMVWGSMASGWNVEVHDVVLAELKAMGANVVLDTNAGGDRTVQISLIENAITEKVDGMIMCDVATEIIDPVIQEAINAGIPVVTEGAFSYAATNDVRNNEWLNGWDAGLLVAKYLAGKPGNVVVAFEPGFLPTEVRFASFSAAMPYLVPSYKVVATVKAQYPNTIPEAKAQMEALLTQFPNEGDINAVFGTYEGETIGMAQAVEESGRDIPVIGVDCTDVVLQAMKAAGSVIKGCIGSDPTSSGKQGAINLINILNGNGKNIPQSTWVQVIPVEMDNISTYTP